MPGVIVLVFAAIMGFAIGLKGLRGPGVQLTRTKTIGGAGGKAIAVACIVFGVLCSLAAIVTMGLLLLRWAG